MTIRIRDTSKTLPRIRDTSKTLPRLDPALIAAALGVEAGPSEEPKPVATLQEPLGPLTLLAVRIEVFQRLQSSGGRPALEGTTRRTKIPLSDEQWQELEKLAAAIATPGCTPTAGQVASVLLRLSVRSLMAELATASEPPAVAEIRSEAATAKQGRGKKPRTKSA